MGSTAQHYLPRFYLNSFASRSKGRRHFIWRYDKATKKEVEIDIAEVCHEKGFYDLRTKEGQVVSYEDLVTQNENRLFPALKAMRTANGSFWASKVAAVGSSQIAFSAGKSLFSFWVTKSS